MPRQYGPLSKDRMREVKRSSDKAKFRREVKERTKKERKWHQDQRKNLSLWGRLNRTFLGGKDYY